MVCAGVHRVLLVVTFYMGGRSRLGDFDRVGLGPYPNDGLSARKWNLTRSSNFAGSCVLHGRPSATR